MKNKKDDFISKLREASPAPPDETEDYSKFNSAFSVVSMIVFVSTAYIVYFSGLLDASDAAWVASLLPILESRVLFLESFDQISLVAFGATVLSCIGCMPIVISGWIIGYWKTVVSKGKCRAPVKDTIIVIFFQIFVSSALIFISFVHTPESYDPRWPGMTFVILYPIFPALGAISAWIFCLMLFSALVGMLKFIFRIGENSV